ncbi:hypothetical protein [Geosporobacter ferrireducens]|uniref:hypothetical protein n=1 Tax=Geosporobacter ferrireducens TaxID=1424294 RepID=UPI00139F135B|nr:hypothetical protein [Geosporobacter ferrireducens]MTI56928.1 hypothetical protein [Geosporobacter ferrireducens]
MGISRGNMLYTLYKKDLKASRFELLLIVGIILAVNLYIFYKTTTGWPPQAGFVMNVGGTITIFIAIFIKAFITVRNEWKENTVYLMMSLPVSGRMIFLSKMLSLLTQWIALEALLGLSAFLFLRGMMTPDSWGKLAEIPFEFKIEVVKLGFLIFLGATQALILAFFSSVVGKLFKKFSGLITFGTFIAGSILTSKVSDIIINAVSRYHLEDLGNSQINFSNGTAWVTIFPNNIYIALTVVLIGVSAALFFGTAAIYDRKVEL